MSLSCSASCTSFSPPASGPPPSSTVACSYLLQRVSSDDCPQGATCGKEVIGTESRQTVRKLPRGAVELRLRHSHDDRRYICIYQQRQQNPHAQVRFKIKLTGEQPLLDWLYVCSPRRALARARYARYSYTCTGYVIMYIRAVTRQSRVSPRLDRLRFAAVPRLGCCVVVKRCSVRVKESCIARAPSRQPTMHPRAGVFRV